MQIFSYTAKDKNGKILKGDIEAESESSAAKVLSSKDLVPILVQTKEEKTFSFLNRVSLKDKVQIIRQLATMINAGLPISQSLKTLEEQITKKNVNRILAQTYSDVESGLQLSVALSRFPETFSALDITLISSGETSGNLDKSLIRLADQLEKQQSITRKIRGAFIYPTIVIVVVIAVAFLMVIFVMPQMEELYESFDAELPLITRFLIAFSHFVARFAIFIFIILVAAGIYLRILTKRPSGKKAWDSLKLKAPAINVLLKKLYMARFSRTLAGLVSSGVPLLDSIDITSRAIGNVVYEEMLKHSATKVKAGVALSETLKGNELFPPVVPQMIGVGEQTGEMDNMLENMANYFEEEVDQAVKNISVLIEPIIIVILAILIGIMLIAVMMPIYQVGQIV
jgi:type IV pilus assembly protein PilC